MEREERRRSRLAEVQWKPPKNVGHKEANPSRMSRTKREPCFARSFKRHRGGRLSLLQLIPAIAEAIAQLFTDRRLELEAALSRDVSHRSGLAPDVAKEKGLYGGFLIAISSSTAKMSYLRSVEPFLVAFVGCLLRSGVHWRSNSSMFLTACLSRDHADPPTRPKTGIDWLPMTSREGPE